MATTTPPPGPVSPIRHANDEATHFIGTNGAVVVVAIGGTVDAVVVDVVVEVEVEVVVVVGTALHTAEAVGVRISGTTSTEGL
jgi:hypothetical protein